MKPPSPVGHWAELPSILIKTVRTSCTSQGSVPPGSGKGVDKGHSTGILSIPRLPAFIQHLVIWGMKMRDGEMPRCCCPGNTEQRSWRGDFAPEPQRQRPLIKPELVLSGFRQGRKQACVVFALCWPYSEFKKQRKTELGLDRQGGSLNGEL